MRLDYAETTLKNGVRVLTARMPQVQSVAIGVWVGVGGRYESIRQSGISHFIEHLLFKGTKTRSARDISQSIEGRGGYFNAFTQEESTCYYARVSARHVWKVHDILAEMYLHPRFDPADIQKERGVIMEEIMMYRDLPQQVVQDMLGELLWTNHPVGRPLIGPTENIERLSREDILRFKTRNYVGGNTLVAFAGQIDHAQAVDHVGAALGGLKRRAVPTCEPVNGRTRQRSVQAVRKDIEQTHLAMGFRLFGRRDPRRYILKVLSIMLGENMSSRLFQVVREKHGLAYAVHSSMHLFNETGALAITAGLDRARTPQAIALIVREIKRMKERPVGAKELRRAKDYAIGQLQIGMEGTTNQMMWIGETILSFGRIVHPEEVMASIESVTAADVQALANAVFRAQKVSAAMVSPDDPALQETRMATALAKLE